MTHCFSRLGAVSVLLLILGAVGPQPVFAQLTTPVLTSVQPGTVPAGEVMTLTGSGFASYNRVVFSGPTPTETAVGSFDGATLGVRTPSTLASGHYSIIVHTVAGASNAIGVQIVGFAPPPGPTSSPVPPGQPTPLPEPVGVQLTSITPSTATPGTNSALSGNGFASYNIILLTGPSGTIRLEVGAISPNDMRFTLPDRLLDGTYHVTLSNFRGTSNALQLNITGGIPPIPIPTTPPFPTILPPPPFPTIVPPPPFPTITPPFPTTTPPPTPQNEYTALGDSIARGFFGLFTYVGYYRNHLEGDLGLAMNVNNIANSGSTSAELLESTRSDASVRGAISRSKIVTWNIGGNDLRRARDSYKRGTCGGPTNEACLRTAVDSFKSNWSAIVSEMAALRGSNQVMRTMDLYYPWVKEDSATDSWPSDSGRNDFTVLLPYFREANAHIAATTSGIPVAHVSTIFNGSSGTEDPSDKGYITFDGYHPSLRGQQVIADTLRNLGYSPLR